MTDLLEPTREDMAAELRREVKIREVVYPRQVAAGRLSAERARWQIAVMRAALDWIEGKTP